MSIFRPSSSFVLTNSSQKRKKETHRNGGGGGITVDILGDHFFSSMHANYYIITVLVVVHLMC